MKALSPLQELAQARRQLLSLCASERFGAAHLLLVGSGRGPETDPGMWEALARQAARRRDAAVAHAARRALWDAGVRGADITLAEAQHLLDAGDHRSAGFVIRSVFGAVPADPTARFLLARSYLAAMRGEADGRRPRTDREMAMALTERFEAQTVVEARVMSDILRFSGEYEAARAQIDAALARFPDDVSLKSRKASVLLQTGLIEDAIDIWEDIAALHGEHRVEALFRLLGANARLGREEEKARAAARLSLEALPLVDRVRLAIEMGRPNVVEALVPEMIRQTKEGAPLPAAEAEAVSELLLDHGYIGLLVWLRRQRVQIGAGAKAVLDACGFGLDGHRIPPRSFEAARGVRSPDFMVPVERFLDLPPKPAGWPGRRRAPERLLLVNNSLTTGGAERQLVMLVETLVREGRLLAGQIDVACFSLAEDRGHAAFLPELRDMGVRVHDLSQRLLVRRTLPGPVARLVQAVPVPLRDDVAALYDLAFDLRPDTLHAWQDRSVLAGGLVAHVLSIEHVVLSLRNMSPDIRQDLGLARLRALYRDCADTPRFRLTANARVAAQDYSRWIGCERGRIDVLTNAVDVERLAALARPAPEGPDAPIRVAGIFRLAANKRPILWLRTLAALRETLDRPVAPVIFGSGPLQREIEEEARRLGLDDLRIERGNTEVADLYGAVDALLLMSRVEGLPNVLLEAQACGLPVAACDVGGVREGLLTWGAGAGLLLPAEIAPEAAAVQLAEWLPRALAAPATGRRTFVERRFSRQALAERAMALYTGAGATA